MKLWLIGFGILLVFTNSALANSDESEDSSEFGVVDGEVTTNCTCGGANKDDERIVGGEEARKNEWPMMAEISARGQHLCGGTIITKRHIITAAHCAFIPKTTDLIPVDMLDVFIGAHEILGDNAFGGSSIFAIEEFIPHPEYHFIKGKQNDIAIILLDDEIDFSSRNAAPACLPIGNEDISASNVKVLGWGLAEYKAESATQYLMKVNLHVQEHGMCRRVYSKYNTRTNICIYTPNKDACQGDSGGPVLWRDPETNRYVLVAVTSYGRKCGIFPAVNANMTYFLPWIQNIISETDSNQKTCAKMTS